MKWISVLIAVGMTFGFDSAAARSSEVLGFGAKSKGGAGGRVLLVTSKDDGRDHPSAGTLRWALRQRGPRIIKFAVGGDLWLEDRIIIREPFLTIDGSGAPGNGVCIRGGSLMFRDTHDVIVKDMRIRLGENPAKKQRRELHARRPPHSAGLDCVSMDDSSRIVFDHCSLSWSCDEIFGITHCHDVTIQWCLLSEPLANPKLHPYGNNHAFPINASASTLSVHHCLLAHYVMRGPQFEGNDLRPEDHYTVQMEAVNNVMFDYERTGSRYGCGVEKNNGAAQAKSFRFQFINNCYVTDSAEKLPIEAITKHGVIAGVKIHESGNVEQVMTGRRFLKAVAAKEEQEPVHAPYWTPAENSAAIRKQVSDKSLFNTSATARAEPAPAIVEPIIADTGCTVGGRDRVDQRTIRDLRHARFGRVRHGEPGLFAWLKFWEW